MIISFTICGIIRLLDNKNIEPAGCGRLSKRKGEEQGGSQGTRGQVDAPADQINGRNRTRQIISRIRHDMGVGGRLFL